ncbi:hypothetical protein [Lichenicoccus sp.]
MTEIGAERVLPVKTVRPDDAYVCPEAGQFRRQATDPGILA